MSSIEYANVDPFIYVMLGQLGQIERTVALSNTLPSAGAIITKIDEIRQLLIEELSDQGSSIGG